MLQCEETEETTTKAPPAYINANYIRQALECNVSGSMYDDKRVNVLECVFQCINEEGANNRSDIYRAHVKFEEYRLGRPVADNTTLIVKDVIMDAATKANTNELVMFQHVLPRMKRILSDISDYRYGTDKYVSKKMALKLFADCLFCERGIREIFVLEDLQELDYGPLEPRYGLDFEESKIVMSKLADLHAASMQYMKEYPNGAATLLPSPLANGISPTSRQAVTAFEGMRNAIKMVEQWTGFGGIAASMRIWTENFNERLTQVLRRRRCRFSVINHGELCTKNILIRLGVQESADLKILIVPKDAVFLDFQLSFVGSCGYDLNVFLYTSVSVEVLKLHRHELLRHYHDRLKETLKRLKFQEAELPSWQTLMGEVYDLEFIGYYALLCLLPLSCMDDVASTEELERQHKLMYENQRVQEMLRYGLPRLTQLGVLDLVPRERDYPPS
ncbi:uncharacterized protein LOC126761667 [Bactrocera neohumeralis]|uniref:uncharacterized protein LOC126761667 n=1 Tax=Bactrocera neohumeralis TaxID=98809 RepID=UPI0021656D7E|nr:uncharacterized protein LOC126761667 [Bactrocera neohumeralis]